MTETQIALLRELSEASGVSGSEDEVRKILARQLQPHVDELRTDALGNLIAIKRAQGTSPDDDRPRLMLAAHMDEVGLMVTAFDDNGALRFGKVGGIADQVLLSKAVLVGKERLPGVIGAKPIHLLQASERQRSVKAKDLYVDIGAKTKTEAERKVKLGDTACFATRFLETPNTLRGKALDDRIGCLLLLELLKLSLPLTVYGAFTVQEEIGLRGAQVAAFAIQPDVALVFEGTVCDDLPKEKASEGPVSSLGRGPALTLRDRAFVADRRLVALMVAEAEANSIPYQFKEPLVGGTDAGPIHLARAGTPTAALSIPCRYVHTPISVASKQDFQNALSLAAKTVERIGREWPFETEQA